MKCDECIHSGVCKFEPSSQYPEYMKRLTCTTCKHFAKQDSKESNAKLKELLQKAVDDIKDILTSQKRITNNTLCEKCKHYTDCSCKEICVTRSDLKQWRHADEAMKLITKDGEQK